MNLGRFHAAIELLVRKYKEDDVEVLLSQMIAMLSQSIGAPNESTSAAFKDAYSSLETALIQSDLNFVAPTRRIIFEDINAVNMIGDGLLLRINEAIQQNQIVPSLALNAITEINSKMTKYFNSLKQIDNSFTELEIEYDELKEGFFEIGVSLPHDISGETLEDIEKEIHKIDAMLKTFNELACEDASSLKVKTISATEWQFFIESAPKVAACMAFAIERIVALYKSNLEIKLLKEQLAEKKLPKAVTKPLEDHIKKTVKIELETLATNIVDNNYKQQDTGRKNELKVKLNKDLTYLADRLDRGATFEVRAEPPKVPEAGEEGVAELEMEKYNKDSELALEINRISNVILALERSEGPTLMLSADVETEKTAVD